MRHPEGGNDGLAAFSWTKLQGSLEQAELNRVAPYVEAAWALGLVFFQGHPDDLVFICGTWQGFCPADLVGSKSDFECNGSVNGQSHLFKFSVEALGKVAWLSKQ